MFFNYMEFGCGFGFYGGFYMLLGGDLGFF